MAVRGILGTTVDFSDLKLRDTFGSGGRRMKWGRATIDFAQRPPPSPIASKTGSAAHFFEAIFDMETSLCSVRVDPNLTRSSPTGGESEHSTFRVTSHTYELRPRAVLTKGEEASERPQAQWVRY